MQNTIQNIGGIVFYSLVDTLSTNVLQMSQNVTSTFSFCHIISLCQNLFDLNCIKLKLLNVQCISCNQPHLSCAAGPSTNHSQILGASPNHNQPRLASHVSDFVFIITQRCGCSSGGRASHLTGRLVV